MVNLVASHGKRIITFANGRRSIIKLLKAMQPDFIICEQTGGSELMLLKACL
ncbi:MULTISPECIES: hypothetical protein [unclassified Rhizobium]|uniref:hypothetical protein n=1 Tax=unclassified Rhizobium TaxID=2613769 RepID=UPI00177B2A5B|nr:MULTISPECIES: hypothetical protein [unclassified Rhizobium]MBD8689600.1 hypothetical protein [Rhizobium sp. CFBP 13644]MBD8694207.1 hypothetical protein [Rhizobium sp. CFBP 13717]